MLTSLQNGRYRILRDLGGGGFGKTFVAEDTLSSDRRTCVIKQFQPGSRDQEFLKIARRLFQSEAETLRTLGSHSQIPELYDSFEEDQEFYLVLEYTEGKALSQQLNEVSRLDESDVIHLLRDVLEVLDFVHQNQVIHRDIKPANLIQRKDDRKYVLIDFGAVKQLQTQLNTELMQTGYTVGIGTHGYGPSEQLMGKPRYSSDIYALGMTAIHALTGMQPAQLPTHPDTGEVIWRDEALVSPKLAAILTKMVRYHFSDRYAAARDVLSALDQPAETILDETQAPLLGDYGVTRPVQDSVREQTRVLRKPARSLHTFFILGLASFAVTGVVAGIRLLGGLQTAELAVYDRMVRYKPVMPRDDRLTIVAITDTDIQTLKRFPIPDAAIAQLIQQLQTFRPRAIGLDLLRDIPQEPGHQALVKALQADNVITITNLGNPPTPAPPKVPADRVGFNDIPLDPSDIARRNLMFLNLGDRDYYSFSLRLALAYLAGEGITFDSNTENRDYVRLGKATFTPLNKNSGGYETIDDRGYQTLLRYRGRNIAQQVSLSDVLAGKVKPEWFQDRVVLIGTTALTAKDLFSTPYSSVNEDIPRMPGVMVHAQMVSQILDAAMGQPALFWFWPEWLEVVWIAGWAILGSAIAWFIRHPVWVGLAGVSLVASLLVSCYSLFLALNWVPFIAPAIAAIVSGGLVIAYRAYADQNWR